jgi:hypothetical protein
MEHNFCYILEKNINYLKDYFIVKLSNHHLFLLTSTILCLIDIFLGLYKFKS